MREEEGASRSVLGISLNVLLLGLVSFITDVSSEMIHPILPAFVEAMGASALAVGLVGGLGDLMQNILKAPSGYLSDKTGRRKAITAAGYGISAVSKLFIPLAASWPQVMALRAVERTGKGVRTAPRDALIAESGGRRGAAFGIHRALDTLGAVVGSSLAFVLLLFLGLPMRDVMLYGAIIAFPALIPLAFVREAGVGKRPRRAPRAEVRLSSSFKAFVAISSLFGLSNMTYMLFMLYVLKFVQPPWGLDPMVFATALYVAFNISYAILSAPGGALSDRVGRKKVIAIGYALFALTCAGFALGAPEGLLPAISLCLFLIYGASKAFFDGTQRAYASDLAPEEAKGYALGVFHTCAGLASLTSGAIAGLIWDLVGASWAFTFATALSAVSAVLLLAFCE